MKRQASSSSFPHPGGLVSGNGGVRVFAPAGPVPSAPPGHSWESLMGRALECAKIAASAGEIPVGAVLVSPDGRVLAEEGNAPVALRDPTAHAEIQVLRRAGPAFGNYRLGGCVLVVTLEPCAMCAAACIHARLAGVVYGAADPQAGAVVSRAEYFDAQSANHSLWHMGGIRAEECAALLRDFFAVRREE